MRAKKEISVGTWLKRRGDTKDPKDAVLVVLAVELAQEGYEVGRVDGMTPTGPQIGRRTWISEKTIQGARYVIIEAPKPPAPTVVDFEQWDEDGLKGKLATLRDLVIANGEEIRALRSAVEDLTAAVRALHPSVQAKLPFPMASTPTATLRGSAS